GAFVHVHIDGIAPALLIVQGVVLDVPDHVLTLLALYPMTDHRAGENRVLAHVLERSAMARLAGQIPAAAQGHVVALRAQLTPDQRPVLLSEIDIPGRRAREIRRQ